MAGEYDDYKLAVEEGKRKDWQRWPWRRPPLKTRLFRAIPYVLSVVLLIAVAIGFIVAFGVKSALMLLGGLLLVFALVPFLCWLAKKRTGI